MLIGVKSLDILLTDDQSAGLNTLAINTLRTFRTFGLVAWGARTLAGSDALASEWKYIAVRRLARSKTIERKILHDNAKKLFRLQ